VAKYDLAVNRINKQKPAMRLGPGRIIWFGPPDSGFLNGAGTCRLSASSFWFLVLLPYP
jgi:hypothetical protein